MRAYYHDNLPGDPRLPHDHIPSKPVSTDRLKKLGVLHLIVPVEGHEPKINAIAEERGYKNRDTIELSQEGPRDVYEDKIRTLYQEHLHEDDEIRYVLSGGGFFDVRGTDGWAIDRCEVEFSSPQRLQAMLGFVSPWSPVTYS